MMVASRRRWCVAAASLLLAASYIHAASIAIDFGLENVKVVLIKPGRTIDVVLNRDSKRKTPAAINIRGEERVFGTDALNLIYKYPKQTYRLLKPLLGRYYSDEMCAKYEERHPNEMASDSQRRTVIFMHEMDTPSSTNFAVEELVAMMLSDLRLQSEQLAGEKIKEATITVPTYFTHWQRRAIKEAAELAGLKVMSLINDGTAVALNYAMPRQFNETEFHVMYDMGAGDTQATVVKFGPVDVKDGKKVKSVQQVEVLAVGWDRTLGGWDIDDRLAKWLEKKFVETKGAKLKNKAVWENTRARLKLEKEANRIKHILSANTDTTASIESLHEDEDFRLKVTRADLEQLVADHAVRAVAPIQSALEQAGVQLKEVSSVVLVGGGVRIPFIRAAIDAFVGEDRVATNLNGDEAAVFGAAFRAATLSKKFKAKEILVKESSPYEIQVTYTSEPKEGEEGQEGAETKQIHTTLYKRGGPVNMRKLMVFRRKSNFDFSVHYVPSDEDKELFGSVALAQCRVTEMLNGLKLHDPALELTDTKVKVSMELDDFGMFEVNDARIFRTITNTTIPEAEPEPEAEAVATATDANQSEEAKATDEASTNATAPKEPPPPRVMNDSYPLGLFVEDMGPSALPKDVFEAIRSRMQDLDNKDQHRREREEAQNNLETLVYKLKELLGRSEWLDCAQELELDELQRAHNEIWDWLFGDSGMSASKDEFQSRIDYLSKLKDPIEFRDQNFKSFGPSMERCIKTIKDAEEFFDKYDNTPESERYHDANEVEKVRKQYNEQRIWVEDAQKRQQDRKCREGLAVTVDAMAERFVNFGMDLAGLTLMKPPVKTSTTTTSRVAEATATEPEVKQTEESLPPAHDEL